MAWQDDAACRSHVELFSSSFGCGSPEQNADRPMGKVCEQIVARCEAICHVCPVEQACLDAALRREERFGVWGGMTPRDRRRLVRTSRLVS